MRTAKEKLLDNGIDEEVTLIDDEAFRESLIGVTMLPGLRAVYSFDKMVEEFMEVHGCSYEDAADYVSYNIVRGLGYMNGDTPIVIDTLNI